MLTAFKSFLRFVELKGIQASGKTTLAKKWVEQFPNVVRVNRDDLRSMLRGDSYRRNDELMVKSVEEAAAKAAVESGYNVVIDDTNLSGSTKWVQLAKSLGIKYTTRHLKVDVGEAIRRDSLREKPVGAKVIRATNARAKW